jgi:hypothetical protein
MRDIFNESELYKKVMCKKYTYNILTTLTFLLAKLDPKEKEVII